MIFAHLLTPNYTGPDICRYLGGAWSMHLPFAWDLTREFRPRTVVELGVYRGESYFTFCQSVEENCLSTLCYGIDTWQGDTHMGMYGAEIGDEVEVYNLRYSRFSKLLKMTFNEARPHFGDASIDLLHIDGSHRYEEVKEDFEAWLPKLSEGGIILFHDVAVHQEDFGVWRLWQEIARERASFVFGFGHGLGIWKKNEVSDADRPFIRKLFLADEKERRELNEHYAIAAAALALKKEAENTAHKRKTSRLEVFTPRDGRYSEDNRAVSAFPKQRWCRAQVNLSPRQQEENPRLRFDPGSEIAVIDIAAIEVRDASNRRLLWRAKGPRELSCLMVGGSAVVAKHDRVFRILNLGADPQVLLPPLQNISRDSLIRFQIWLRLDTSAESVAECFAALQHQQRRDIESKTAALHELEQQRSALTAELRGSEQQRELLQTELRDTEEQRAILDAALHEHQAELTAHRSEVQRLEREVWDNKVRRADFAARLKERDQWIKQVESSLAWKAARPLWKIQKHFARRNQTKSDQQRPSDEIVFALDSPGVWNAARDSVELKGWCFTRGGPQIVGVRAKVGRKSYFARYGLIREDVADATAYPAALYSGFALTLPVTAEGVTVRLEAIAQNGPWRCFLEHSLASSTQIHPAGALTERHEPEPNAPEHLVLPIHANGQQPVLYPTATADDVARLLAPLIKRHLRSANYEKPLFSVLTPTFNTQPRWLVEAAASLLSQAVFDWEWCLIDDGSHGSATRRALDSLATEHPGFRVKYLANGGISAATNQALDIARGNFVCFLDHDDLMHPDALQVMRDKLAEGFDVVYSDEDKLDDKHGTLTEPFFKPDWSPEYFRGAMYVGHLLCVRRELACQVRFATAFDGVQDFDFMLRISETGARIGHVPKILYHWRKTAGSIADASSAKPQAALLQQKAVNAQLKRMGLQAEAKLGSIPHRLKIVPTPRSTYPKVSIVIPTKDAPDLLARCLKSLHENTAYSNFEVVMVDNDTTSREAIELMRKYPVTRVYLPNPFNYSCANNLGAKTATGKYLIFLNNDTEIISGQWIDQLLYYAEQRDVGAAGALLLHENGTVQHAGVVLGMRGTADHAMRGFRAKSDGYAGSLSCAREVSAVTAACMMMRKSLFEKIGGFNEHFFTIYQDVDLCLRLRKRGLRIIWTPQALLLHHESLSRQTYYDFVDRYLLLDQWQDIIGRGDPYYNRNLNTERGDYSLHES